MAADPSRHDFQLRLKQAQRDRSGTPPPLEIGGAYETFAKCNLRIYRGFERPSRERYTNDSRLAFVFPMNEDFRTDSEVKYAINAAYDADGATFTAMRAKPTNRDR